MRSRCEQHDACNLLWISRSEGERVQATERVTDQDVRASNVRAIEQCVEIRSERRAVL
jgi:hypothetical protein